MRVKREEKIALGTAMAKKEKLLTAARWLMCIVLFVLLMFDIWYFFLWPQYGWRPFRGLDVSDIETVKIVRSLREAEISEDEIVRLVDELSKIRIYPPQGKYEELLGGRFVMFKMVLKNGVGKEIWLSDYDKYFWIDWTPYFQSEDSVASEHSVSELYSELVDQYLN